MKAGTQAQQRLGVRWQNPKGVTTPLSTAGGVIERPQALKNGVTAAALQDAQRSPVLPLFALLLFLTTSLHAHHGRDFILIQDSAIPDYLSGVAIAGYEWTSDGDTNEFSTEPGFFIGLTSALAFGLSAGFSDGGDGWEYNGITPQFVISLLPATGARNYRIGLWAGYEFAEDASGVFSASTHAHGGNGGGGGPDGPPPAGRFIKHHGAAAGGGSGGDAGSPGGVLRAGESGLHSRLIFEADVTSQTRAVLNVLSFVSGDGGKPGFGYAIGLRHEFSHDLSLGIETLGDFEERQSSHQILFTTMIGLPKHFSLRMGVGTGLTRSASDFTLHSSVLWRF
jgi:hypothetical protein